MTDDAETQMLENAVISQSSPLSSIQQPQGESQSLNGAGASPLSQSNLATKITNNASEMMPSPEDINTKRQGLMDAYQKLIAAQAYVPPPVADLPAATYAAGALKDAWNPSITAQGQGLENELRTRMAMQAQQRGAGEQQANTGLAAAQAGTGFNAQDLKQAMDVMNANAINNFHQNMLGIRNDQLIKDSQGNPIGTYDKISGKIVPLSGSTSATPEVIPGLMGGANNPINAGMTQIFKENDLDPSRVGVKSRTEYENSAKDSENDVAILNATQSAAQTAARAKDVLNAGYSGGLFGSAWSAVNANLPAEGQSNLTSNRDLLNKYSGQISSVLATQLKGARIGVGMERFLKNTTFNPDIGKDANMEIVNNLQDLPKVAQQNMKLGAYINNLPESYKNTVYNEFLRDNPPYSEQERNGLPPKYSLNPAYNDPQMVKNWFAKRAGAAAPEAAPAGGAPAKPMLPPDVAAAEYKRRLAAGIVQ